MPVKSRAVGRARWHAPRLLVLAAAATTLAGLSGGMAPAEELTIATAPMIDVTAVDMAAPEANAAAPELSTAAPEADRAAPAEPSVPTVVARVDLSDQTMTVYVDERLSYEFKVSTGRSGYGTPTGRWNAAWLSPYHRSKKYHNAPMPWSVFFHGGYAVHGTTEVRRLGRAASHGCVRLHPANAKIFYKLVQEYGKENTLVSIVR
jgi:lipoprotein-anchoring transpeptidase ErfK/SrfK